VSASPPKLIVPPGAFAPSRTSPVASVATSVVAADIAPETANAWFQIGAPLVPSSLTTKMDGPALVSAPRPKSTLPENSPQTATFPCPSTASLSGTAGKLLLHANVPDWLYLITKPWPLVELFIAPPPGKVRMPLWCPAAVTPPAE